ncbi:MAG: hypothetical protein AABX34_07135 [Nanoarchaeota archaeon]
MKLQIPSAKSHLNRGVEARQFTAPDGQVLTLYIPRSSSRELEAAWEVLGDYTARMAPNPESALQDLDDIDKVRGYHFSNSGYLIFTAVDKNRRPVAVAPAEIVPLSDVTTRKAFQGKSIGLVYQIGHTSEISDNDRDFSVASELYRAVASTMPRLLRQDSWAGTVTESRKEGPELEAILNAGFVPLVPNSHYRPPAVRQEGIQDSANKTTTDLVLLARDIPQMPHAGLVAARAYVTLAYVEGQNIQPTLQLIGQHFSGK